MVEKSRVLKILEYLPSFWDKEVNSRTYNIIKAFADEFDYWDLERLNLINEIRINSATGSYLNDIGKLYGLTRRSGETDSQYRARIKAFFPGYSGGGTKPGIKSALSSITEVPEVDITVSEFFDLKFKTSTLFDSEDDISKKQLIKDSLWDIKAAGSYPLFEFVLGGDLTAEDIEISDSVQTTPSTWFIIDISLIDGDNLLK